MINKRIVDRDERTVAVENESYALGFKVMSFAILLDVAYKGLKLDQASWDLLAIIICSGMITTIYQNRFKVLTKRWLVTGAFTLAVAAAVAALFTFLIRS